ncbi:protein of unknown function (DUF3497) [Parelaphostrongylus tenuis]|uniref:Uncharacterized protein n=1 Tax=Parelaphostrongylus tenuis TaxID=148309 RepID=A0AAD5R594_PARTN|nr:protein of unknown function (DUF3497) [Parelaphostrongylus tenuis]
MRVPSLKSLLFFFYINYFIGKSGRSSASCLINDTIRSEEQGDVFLFARYCDAETFGGIRYPRTRTCSDACVACPDPDNVIGMIVRYCSCETAEWELPDTTNCTHKWIAETKLAIERGDQVEEISGRMAANLESTVMQQLYGGDIIGSVSLSTDILGLARHQFSLLFDRNQRQRKATNFTESFGSSGDHLLSPRAVSTWEELPQAVRIKHASTLMGVLERSALLLADYSVDEQKKILYKNWALEIDVRRADIPSRRSGRVFAASDGFREAQLLAMNDNFQALPGPLRPRTTAPKSPSVQFSEFSQSPIITLPSLDVLKTSSDAANPRKPGTPGALFYPGGPMPKATLDRSRIRLGYYVFTTFGKLLDDRDGQAIVNSHVIGASVDDATIRLSLPDDQPATFTFYHLQRDGVSNPRCVYWDLNNKKWSTDGCRIISTDFEATKCACNHLTSFAVLMDFSGKVSKYSGAIAAALDVVSIIGCALSIVCLTMSLFVFTFFSSLYSVRNAIHRNLCLTLIFSELIFVVGIDRTENRIGCSIVALLLHYFFLVAFCWMLLEGYQLYLMLIQVFEPDKTRMLLYYMFSYGLPAVVVAVSAGVAWHNYGTHEYCWIDTSTPTIWAFIGPILVVIINVTFLAVAFKVVLSVKSRDRNKSDRVIGWLKGSATLLCLLGITWIFGFLTVINGTGGVVFAWIFTILNCSQGVFIFILHVVMNEKVCSTVARWLRSGVCCLPSKTSTDNSKEYISSRHRIMNIVKTNFNSGSSPDTASTDDKEKQLTPISKTSEWLRCVSRDNAGSPLSSPRLSQDTETIQDDNMNNHSRYSQMEAQRDSVEKHAPVKRKKFPLGVSEYERGSKHVIVERF